MCINYTKTRVDANILPKNDQRKLLSFLCRIYWLFYADNGSRDGWNRGHLGKTRQLSRARQVSGVRKASTYARAFIFESGTSPSIYFSIK